MYEFEPLTSTAVPASVADKPATQAMIEEIHEHLIFVLREKLVWMDASQPEMSAGGGHVVIRFERSGHRFVFRVGKHGSYQHKRTMLAYRHLDHLGVIPEKIYHDAICLIERYAAGTPLSEQVSDLVLKSLAIKLSKIHAMGAKGFGPLEFNAVGIFADASSYYCAQPQLKLNWAEADLSDDDIKQLNDALLDANTMPTALLAAPVCIGHGDLWCSNVLVTETDFKILDWDRIGAYPMERDLAFLLELGFSARQRELFFSFYTFSDAVDVQLLRWFSKHRVMRDHGLRLGKKLAKIRSIDSAQLSTGLLRT